ncbi:MAG: SIS domain-containing protein [Chloroflexota bacterium]|nr:SIS domain-containing protein [Chloroflexota bacterium]MDE2958492.1 SIS domain-containing protein [Chloroflexota bacterium]
MTTHAPRTQHPYFMYDAIVGQPEAIRTVIATQSEHCAEVAAVLSTKRRIYVVGIGTSWHAALVGASIMDGEPEAFACNSFEFCVAPPRVTADDAVIVISHRGTKRSSYDALDVANSLGAYTVAITSTDPGPRILVADAGIRTVEQEKSAAFTVSYTTALTVLALLNLGIAGRLDDPGNGLDAFPGQIAGILAQDDDVRAVVADHHSRRRFISAGWGANRANAYEVALKIKETSRADCEGFQIEQLLHGPFCSLDSQCLLTLIAPAGEDRGRSVDLAQAARELGTPVWAPTNRHDDDLADAGAVTFPLPECPSYLMPIASVVPLQLFTYHLALARGTHPDLFQQDDPLQAAARTHYDL